MIGSVTLCDDSSPDVTTSDQVDANDSIARYLVHDLVPIRDGHFVFVVQAFLRPGSVGFPPGRALFPD